MAEFIQGEVQYVDVGDKILFENVPRYADRLDRFYDVLRDVHKEHFPDWRFGQLMTNFLGWVYSVKKRDPFFPEEDEMLMYIREYGEKWGMYS